LTTAPPIASFVAAPEASSPPPASSKCGGIAAGGNISIRGSLAVTSIKKINEICPNVLNLTFFGKFFLFM
jgi:hypothetical protein